MPVWIPCRVKSPWQEIGMERISEIPLENLTGCDDNPPPRNQHQSQTADEKRRSMKTATAEQ
jgi:hypothetical protein